MITNRLFFQDQNLNNNFKRRGMVNIKKMKSKEQRILSEVRHLLSEKDTTKSKSNDKLTKGQKIVIDSWNALKNKTKVFETIPLIYALSDKKELSLNDMMTLLKKNYDWDSEGRDWLMSLIKKINFDPSAEKTFIEKVVKTAISESGPSMKEIYGGKKIDGFIHGSITKFYAALKKNSKHSDESKTFTADVVLIWGPQTAYKINKIIDGDLLKKLTSDKNSLVTLSDNKTVIACVSLKALEGRVGKVTSIFSAMLGTSAKTESSLPISEGITDSLKNALKSAGKFGAELLDKVKDSYNKFTNWVKGIGSLIKSIVSPSNPIVLQGQAKNEEILADAENVLRSFDQLVVDHYNKLGKPITEVSETDEIEITTCFRDQILKWYDKFERDAKKYNEPFKSFASKASEYSNKNFFRLSFTELDETKKTFDSEMRRISTFVKRIESAKVPADDKVSKRKTCKTILISNKPVTISRKELKTILMSNANFISIEILNNLVDQYLAKSKSLKAKDAIENLISFSTKLNAEAIFGGALEMPLIKYDGKKIIRYGSRGQYEKNHSVKLAEYFNSIKTLPVVGIKIYPPKSKIGGISSYYSVIMYSIADYKMSETGKVLDSDFIYNIVAFKCNSGSSFAFTVESDAVTTGDKVVKALASDKEVQL